MDKSIQMILVVSFIALTTHGCVGFILYQPDECENETPTTRARDFFRSENEKPPSSFSSKSDFLKEWGKPDIIITASENRETWIYKRHLWCGVSPCFGICIPLMLPVCDGFERIEFQGDEAKCLHIRRIVAKKTAYIGYAIGEWSREHGCRYPIPCKCTGYDEAKPVPKGPP